MSTRVVHIYALATLIQAASTTSQTQQVQQQEADPSTHTQTITTEPLQERESALKFMTRAIACMPSDAGFACSSIEGRVAVEWFDPSEASQARKYAFKCHRVTQESTDNEGNPESVDVVYPVHCLAFHPTYGTFASGGGDGVVSLWDAMAKRRIKQYQKFGASVVDCAFSCDGEG